MNEYTASAWNEFSFCQLACNYYSTCAQNGFFTSKNLFESSSVVLVSTYCQSGISGDIGERERVYCKRCVCVG